MKGLKYIIITIVFCLLPYIAFGQELEELRGTQGPIHISSQRYTIYSGRLLLFLNEGGDEIDKIVAQGNVRMVQGKRVATCQEATYYNRERKVILLGDPVLREGDNWVKGRRIIYYIDEQKSVAEGKGEERVTVTIFPRSDKK
jgi:lipopolysaccharide export system protein LptA